MDCAGLRGVAASVCIIAFLAGGGGPLPSRAQISADRPGFGDGTATVSARTVQAGMGYAFNGGGVNSHELGQLLLRYGLTSRLELRGGVNSYVVAESPLEDGYSGTSVGVKLSLFRSALTAVSGVATVGLPTGTGDVEGSDDRVRQEVKLVYDGSLGENLTLSVNGGTRFYYAADAQDERDLEVLFVPTLSVGLTRRTGGYFGYAGFFDEGANENWVEGGLTFLYTASTQLDVNAGLHVDDRANAFFLGLGLAHRF